VDDSEIKEGDWYYDFIYNKIDKCNLYIGKHDTCKKITHSTQPLGIGWQQEVIELSLQEVKELLGEVDVEKKAVNSWEGCDGCDTNDELFFTNGYQRGYNQCLEDNKDKKYTEEDILNILYDYDNIDWSKKEHKQSVIMMKEWLYEKLQSFQPKTEWNVEIVDGKLKLKL
jgi:hypothetical protein